MKYPAYSEYKDSGVEWLGNVPKVWNVLQLRRCVMEHKQGFYTTEDYLDEGGVKLLRITDIASFGDVSFEKCPNVLIKKKDEAFLLENDDFVFARTGGVGNFAFIKNIKEPVVFASYLIRFRFLETIHGHFLKYYFLSEAFIKGIHANIHGGVNQNVHAEDIKNQWIGFPIKDEQITIANFLDQETAKIDTLINKQQKLISLLQEKRQAVISHAVTKGINPDAKMKDSGVEWLGDVPEHWGISSLCYYANISTGATPDRSQQIYWRGDIPWVKTGEVKYDDILETEEHITVDAVANSSVTLSPPGTLLMAMYGQGVTRGRVAILGVTATYNQACAAIVANNKLLNRYLRYYFMASYHAIRDGGNETSQMNLNADIVGKFKIAIPPFSEQIAITDFLNREIVKFDKLINKATKAIKLIQERRTALVSAAVTGKIDVRNA